MAIFGRGKEIADQISDAITGRGKGNVKGKIVPDNFNDIWQEVNNQHDMGFGRTQEETWENNERTAKDMKAWRARYEAEKEANGEEDKPLPW